MSQNDKDSCLGPLYKAESDSYVTGVDCRSILQKMWDLWWHSVMSAKTCGIWSCDLKSVYSWIASQGTNPVASLLSSTILNSVYSWHVQIFQYEDQKSPPISAKVYNPPQWKLLESPSGYRELVDYSDNYSHMLTALLKINKVCSFCLHLQLLINQNIKQCWKQNT